MPTPVDSETPSAVERGQEILQAVGSTRVTIDWQRSMPWWFFTSGFVRLGWRFSHVAFATLGVWLSYVGLQLTNAWFLGGATANGFAVEFPRIVAMQPTFQFYREVINAPWRFNMGSLAGMALLFVWLVLVWGFIGGVICRRSVIELGARTTIGWTSSIKLVLRRLRAIFEATGLPALAAFALCLMPFLLGIIARLGSIGEVVASIGVLGTFIFALPIAWLSLLTILGFPLMTAAIVTEKESDAFDGLSRSAAYLFQRPVTIMVAIAVAGVVISLLTSIIGSAYTASSSLYSSAFLSGAGLNTLNDLSTGFAKGIFGLVQVVLGLIVAGLAASLFWSATAAVYLIVRREVDHTEYDELDLQEVGSPLALPSSNYEDNKLLKIEGSKQHHQAIASGSSPATNADSAANANSDRQNAQDNQSADAMQPPVA